MFFLCYNNNSKKILKKLKEKKQKYMNYEEVHSICTLLGNSFLMIEKDKNPSNLIKNNNIVVTNPYIINDKFFWLTYLKPKDEENTEIKTLSFYSLNCSEIKRIGFENGQTQFDVFGRQINFSEKFSLDFFEKKENNSAPLIILPIYKKDNKTLLMENILIDRVKSLINIK